MAMTLTHTIDLAQAEVKFFKARVALLEAEEAYRAILAKEGLPYRDVEDRVLMLSRAIHDISTTPVRD